MNAMLSAPRPLEEGDIPALSSLVAARFLQDPKSAFEVAGVQRPECVLRILAEETLRHALGYGHSAVLNGAGGVLLWHARQQEHPRHTRQLEVAIAQALQRALPAEDLGRLIHNQECLGSVAHRGWKRAACPGAYYEIDLLCVAPAAKGTGALRALLFPLLRQADAAAAPILVETHNPATLPIYEHFGFSLLHAYPGSPDSGVTQYSLTYVLIVQPPLYIVHFKL